MARFYPDLNDEEMADVASVSLDLSRLLSTSQNVVVEQAEVESRMTRSKSRRVNFEKDLVDKGRDINFVKQAMEEKCNEVFTVCEENLVMDEEEMGDPRYIYSVELSVKEHGREDVKEAKRKEIENLRNYNVFDEVRDTGQTCIGA